MIMIWDKLPHHFTCLAPMEGVTDVVFRAAIAKAGRPDLFFTEFTNVSSFASEKGRHDALERLSKNDTDSPIIAQIWGKNPDHFAELAGALERLGFEGLDINMGCPDKHVVKAGGGSNMIRTPDLAVECIKRAKENTNLPVSVKTRLGFTYVDEYKEWIPLLLKQNIANLTVHLRTRKEMSKVKAHFELIPEIIKMRDEIAPQAKLTFNGDILAKTRPADDTDEAHVYADELFAKYPDIDGVMIGRGVFSNPYCFADKIANREDLLELFRYHLDLFDAHQADLAERNANESNEKLHLHYPYEPLKRMFKVYLHSFPGASDLRAELMDCKTTDELRSTLDKFTLK
ncbi:MAG: tRNA-dihydrouridine synthase [Candidatus Saccharibacteria bacterium]|nr:tRNA-dihydrouridine synthase [Candidatus Saccharibacteria bacterium]